ncbi:hypothetical protein NQ317_019636 [Molorchus minor]|uniref:Uncharacterized protein n=1 Tax=Molorchus minor TaxID=1323400 RepID=A0ABQ9IWK2_9CUCU|nr:hypothetical protein NQ317_019636 [Molorchus minor]
MRQRKQQVVAKENLFYMQLMQQALPVDNTTPLEQSEPVNAIAPAQPVQNNNKIQNRQSQEKNGHIPNGTIANGIHPQHGSAPNKSHHRKSVDKCKDHGDDHRHTERHTDRQQRATHSHSNGAAVGAGADEAIKFDDLNSQLKNLGSMHEKLKMDPLNRNPNKTDHLKNGKRVEMKSPLKNCVVAPKTPRTAPPTASRDNHLVDLKNPHTVRMSCREYCPLVDFKLHDLSSHKSVCYDTDTYFDRRNDSVNIRERYSKEVEYLREKLKAIRNKTNKNFENSSGDSLNWPIRPSLFPHIPPYIHFRSHDSDVEYKAPSGRRFFKWKLSTITPVVVRKTLTNSGFALVRTILIDQIQCRK